MNDVQAVVPRRAGDLAGQPETREHTVGVVVGAAADVGEHTGHRRGAERLGAQLDSESLELVSVIAVDQHLDLATVRGHCRDAVVQHIDARRIDEFTEGRHAVG